MKNSMKSEDELVLIKRVIDPDGHINFHIAEEDYTGRTIRWLKSKWRKFVEDRERYNDGFLELKNQFDPPKDKPIVVKPEEVVKF